MLLGEADALEPAILALDGELRRLGELRVQVGNTLPPWATPEDLAGLWEVEDKLREQQQQRLELRLNQEEHLFAALERDPEYRPVHARMAQLQRERLLEAELRQDEDGARRAIRRLLRHDPEGDQRRWLDAPARIRVESDPPVPLSLWEEGGRLGPRLREVKPGPATFVLPPGVYRVDLGVPQGRLRVPLLLRRGDDLHVSLPLFELGAEECLVWGGKFLLGDGGAPDGLPEEEAELPAFVAKIFPVRVREYFDFLNGLVEEGAGDLAVRHAPSSPVSGPGFSGGPCWVWEGGRMVPLRDERGPMLPEHPICHVDWEDACACAAWFARRDGLPWRLPGEREWEKAARGVDGRRWPWGNHPMPPFANVVDSSRIPPSRVEVDRFPKDESPYGLRGVAGNLREWCVETYTRFGRDPDPNPDPEFRIVRGGSYLCSQDYTRLGARRADWPAARKDSISFRLVRSLPNPTRRWSGGL